ncbi:sulfite exporter TauE/SafE family protein [Anaerolineales bacterium HSG25]|nr:sulfite exporter TauE/SafE family protein [Anaerolineales bacterium HSG25]
MTNQLVFLNHPPLFWLIVVSAVILVGIAKAGFGGGLGVIATPLMSLVMPVADAAALLLPLLIVADLFSVRHYRNHYDSVNLRLLLPGALIGIALGAFFFDLFSDNERVLKMGVGFIALGFVLFQTTRPLVMENFVSKRPSPILGTLLGGLTGFTSTLAHVGGPPATIYLLPQNLPRQLFVGTLVILFMVVNLVKLVPYWYLGLLRWGNLTTTLLLLPAIYIGVKLGVWLNQNFNELWFNRLVYGLFFLTGLQLIIGQSVMGLFWRVMGW